MFSNYRFAKDGVRLKHVIYFIGFWATGNVIFISNSLRVLKKKRPIFNTTPPPSDDRRMDFFDRNATRFDRILDQFDDIVLVKVVLGKKKAPALFGMAKGNVLEIAAGTGRNFEHLKNNAKIKSLTCIDVSPRMAAVMKEKLEIDPLPYPVDILVADVNNMPFESNKFDTIISTFTLCSLSGDVLTAMRETMRVCKCGGRLLFIERGISHYSIFRWLLRTLEIAPNTRVAWELGHYEDRSPLKILSAAKIPLRKVKHYNFGMLYVISAFKPSGASIKKT